MTRAGDASDLNREPDPLMRILDLRESLQGHPFTLTTVSGGTICQYSFTEDEPFLGGFAAVFRVVDGGNSYALKIAHRTDASAERMQQEHASSEIQRVLRENGGPVPMTYHVGHVEGVPALIMSWETGESLRVLLDALGNRRRRAGAALDRLASWIEAVVRAMAELDRRVAELHGDGEAGTFVHGDLKPSNILIRKGRSRRERVLATLLDFGEAGLGAPVGPTGYSEAYASPEIVRRSLDASTQVTWRSDQYAIGRMLLEGLEQLQRAGIAVRSGFRIRRFGRVARLTTVATRMTAVDPNGRYGSWDEVLDALQSRTRKRILRWSIAATVFLAAGLLLSLLFIQGAGLSAVVVRTTGPEGRVRQLADTMEVVCTTSPFKPDPKSCPIPDSGEEARIELPFEVDVVQGSETFSLKIVMQPKREGIVDKSIGIFDGWRGKRIVILDQSIQLDGTRSLRAELQRMLKDRSMMYGDVQIEVGFR